MDKRDYFRLIQGGRMEPIFNFLENPVWPKSLKTDVVYDRQHDDTDGGDKWYLMIQFSNDGDAWVSIDNQKPIRFRNYFGGGRSLKTYAALLVLAEAIRQDNNA
jgi:hypothetical protein